MTRISNSFFRSVDVQGAKGFPLGNRRFTCDSRKPRGIANTKNRRYVAVFNCIIFLVSLLFLLAGPNRALSQNDGSEQFVEISANIEVWSYDLRKSDTNAVDSRNAFPVKFVVGLRRWWIETHFLRNAIDTYYFDGSNVFSAQKITGGGSAETNKVLATQPTPFTEPSEKTKSINWIVISPTSDPAGNLGVNLPWLAFCSGDFLRQTGRIIPLPASVARAMRDAYAYVDTTTTFEDDLGLPTTVQLFFSTNQFERSGRDPRLGRQTQTFHTQAMPDGQLKFRYEVGLSTNILGWHFPVTFHFVQYEYDKQRSWRPRYEGKGQALSFALRGEPENVFQAGKHQVVRDYRFRSEDRAVDLIAYDTTSGTPPSTNEERLQALFQKSLAESDPAGASVRADASGGSSRDMRATPFRAILAALILLALISFAVLKIHRGKQNKS